MNLVFLTQEIVFFTYEQYDFEVLKENPFLKVLCNIIKNENEIPQSIYFKISNKIHEISQKRKKKISKKPSLKTNGLTSKLLRIYSRFWIHYGLKFFPKKQVKILKTK